MVKPNCMITERLSDHIRCFLKSKTNNHYLFHIYLNRLFPDSWRIRENSLHLSQSMSSSFFRKTGIFRRFPVKSGFGGKHQPGRRRVCSKRSVFGPLFPDGRGALFVIYTAQRLFFIPECGIGPSCSRQMRNYGTFITRETAAFL